MPFGHLYVFFREISIHILCPVLIRLFVLAIELYLVFKPLSFIVVTTTIDIWNPLRYLKEECCCNPKPKLQIVALGGSVNKKKKMASKILLVET